MPPPEGRAGNLSVYLVCCLLLFASVGGGALLVLYVILPESEATVWFLVAGLVLVGTPWLFWAMTCLYRTVSVRMAAGSGGAGRAPGRTTTAAPAVARTPTAVNEDTAVESPGGARRVQFGDATVPGCSQETPRGGGSGLPLAKPDGDPKEEASGYAHGDGSSHASHESEMPLFPASS